MRTLFAFFVTSFLATVVAFQMLWISAATARPRYFPSPSIPTILSRFQQYATGDVAELAAWYGTPFPPAFAGSDFVLLCNKLGFVVDLQQIKIVIVAVDLDGDHAVSLIDAAYGVAAAMQTWYVYQTVDPAVRSILRTANISEVSLSGLQHAIILPHAKYPLQLLAAVAGSAVLATLEEVVHAWWAVLDVNGNGRLDMNEMMTLHGARWAARLGTTKLQALQHAGRTAALMQAEIQDWIYKK
jgi:hypothetical protein